MIVIEHLNLSSKDGELIGKVSMTILNCITFGAMVYIICAYNIKLQRNCMRIPREVRNNRDPFGS